MHHDGNSRQNAVMRERLTPDVIVLLVSKSLGVGEPLREI